VEPLVDRRRAGLADVEEVVLGRVAHPCDVERGDESRAPVVLSAGFAMPEPHVAERIRWSGGEPAAVAPSPGAMLPILMYHRLSTSASAASARYAVSPDAFREQLAYLRDAGFHTVSLADWTAALQKREPLPAVPSR